MLLVSRKFVEWDPAGFIVINKFKAEVSRTIKVHFNAEGLSKLSGPKS